MLRFTTAGESHGKALVTIVEGLPAGLPVSAEWVDRELARRMQGYGRGARMKIERDHIEWLSGVRAGETLGSLEIRFVIAAVAIRSEGLAVAVPLDSGLVLGHGFARVS